LLVLLSSRYFDLVVLHGKEIMKASQSFSLLVFMLVTMLFGHSASADLPDFRDIVKSNSPAVVKILVEQKSVRGGQAQGDSGDIPEPLRRFFQYRGSPQSQRQEMSMGSGFIVSESGYIVTNNHVVEGADSVLVRLSDRREFDAEIIGTDPRSDLALLRIDAENLPALKLAEAGELEVGEWVLAIGSPFGLDYSVTAGIVSAMGRSLPTEQNENYVPFIQTDVAINPGNSGGPLFNLQGEVVGVNSQIFTRSGGSIGLSFAIPISVVRNVVDQLKEDGRVTRGWLGVTIQNVDKNLAESFGLDRPQGALIAQLSSDGPAEKSGLRAGDVIIAFDGQSVENSADLPHIVGLLEPDSTVDVKLVRDRKIKTVQVKVGGLDADDSYALSNRQPDGRVGGRLGLVAEEIPEDIQLRLELDGGVVIRRVVSGSIAAKSGMLPGDVITQVGADKIDSLSDLTKAVKKLSADRSVPVRLIRRGAPMFIGLKLSD
jgi:serine protease Do